MTPSQPPSQADIATLNVRMTSLENKMQQVEERVESRVSQQVNEIQIREKDRQFNAVQLTLDRIEREQQGSKKEQSQQLKEMHEKIDNLKTKGLERALSICLGVFGGVLVTVIGIGLVYFFTHIGG